MFGSMISPAMLSMALPKLRQVFEDAERTGSVKGETIPSDVIETGRRFLDALERWQGAKGKTS